eukprot:749427-Rhodomonas_salina.1
MRCREQPLRLFDSFATAVFKALTPAAASPVPPPSLSFPPPQSSSLTLASSSDSPLPLHLSRSLSAITDMICVRVGEQ